VWCKAQTSQWAILVLHVKIKKHEARTSVLAPMIGRPCDLC
jgi:hypothetical protein